MDRASIAYLVVDIGLFALFALFALTHKDDRPRTRPHTRKHIRTHPPTHTTIQKHMQHMRCCQIIKSNPLSLTFSLLFTLLYITIIII